MKFLKCLLFIFALTVLNCVLQTNAMERLFEKQDYKAIIEKINKSRLKPEQKIAWLQNQAKLGHTILIEELINNLIMIGGQREDCFYWQFVMLFRLSQDLSCYKKNDLYETVNEQLKVIRVTLIKSIQKSASLDFKTKLRILDEAFKLVLNLENNLPNPYIVSFKNHKKNLLPANEWPELRKKSLVECYENIREELQKGSKQQTDNKQSETQQQTNIEHTLKRLHELLKQQDYAAISELVEKNNYEQITNWLRVEALNGHWPLMLDLTRKMIILGMYENDNNVEFLLILLYAANLRLNQDMNCFLNLSNHRQLLERICKSSKTSYLSLKNSELSDYDIFLKAKELINKPLPRPFIPACKSLQLKADFENIRAEVLHDEYTDFCYYCKKSRNENGRKALQLCDGCRKIRYCSKECQRQDWSRHKSECVKKEKKKSEDRKEERKEDLAIKYCQKCEANDKEVAALKNCDLCFDTTMYCQNCIEDHTHNNID